MNIYAARSRKIVDYDPDKVEQAQGVKVRAARLGVDISHCLSLAEAKEACARAALMDEIEAGAIAARLAIADVNGINALNYQELAAPQALTNQQHSWEMVEPPAEWRCKKCGKMDFEYVPDMSATCSGPMSERIENEVRLCRTENIPDPQQAEDEAAMREETAMDDIADARRENKFGKGL